MEPLAQLMAIIAAEVGEDTAQHLLAAARMATVDDELGQTPTAYAIVECLWDVFARAKPDAFHGPVDASTGVGLAYRYARRRQSELIGAVALTAAEHQTLKRVRQTLREWSRLDHWGRFRHVAFAHTCTALTATVAARDAYCGGFALTWHRGLKRTAIYPAERIHEYREVATASLVSVLLHEEAHLAAALATPWCHGEGELVAAVQEVAAEIVQHTACLVAVGYLPTRGDLVDYFAEIGEKRLLRFNALLSPRANVSELVWKSSALAVAAARGERALTVAASDLLACARPRAALARALAAD